MTQYLQPKGNPISLTVTETPAKLGGTAFPLSTQGNNVSLYVQNVDAGNTVFILPLWDGTTPVANDVLAGQQILAGSVYSDTGIVGTDGTGHCLPQFWVVCSSGETAMLVGRERR